MESGARVHFQRVAGACLGKRHSWRPPEGTKAQPTQAAESAVGREGLWVVGGRSAWLSKDMPPSRDLGAHPVGTKSRPCHPLLYSPRT